MTKPIFNKPTLDQIVSNPSCMDDYDPNAMSVAQARQFIQQFLSPVVETETVPVRNSLGRVLAADIISPSNVPNHNNSAMDGFAFKYSDHLKTLKVIGTAFAGKAFAGVVNPGECVKIMTGAVIPAGADTVVMQERTKTRVKRTPCWRRFKAWPNRASKKQYDEARRFRLSGIAWAWRSNRLSPIKSGIF
jgi:molybdopterin molybdotransferase